VSRAVIFRRSVLFLSYKITIRLETALAESVSLASAVRLR
jgi:hypothetical protein